MIFVVNSIKLHFTSFRVILLNQSLTHENKENVCFSLFVGQLGIFNSPCQYQNKYMTRKVRRRWKLM